MCTVPLLGFRKVQQCPLTVPPHHLKQNRNTPASTRKTPKMAAKPEFPVQPRFGYAIAQDREAWGSAVHVIVPVKVLVCFSAKRRAF